MKTVFPAITIGLLLATAAPVPASANVVGYYNYNFISGDNFFQNNLLNTDNHVSAVLFPPSSASATLSLWNVGSRQFVETAFWDGSTWLDANYEPSTVELLPGMGAKLWVSNPYINTFVGEVVTRDGSPLSGEPFNFGTATPPPPGVYCLGDKVPLSGTNVFQRVIGRAPSDGEQVILANAFAYTYRDLAGGWVDSDDNMISEPNFVVGEAALFNIGPVDFTYVVPEPSTTALCLLSLALLAARRKA